MDKHTCEFYDSSDVFDGCPEAFDAFTDSDPDCTWGDNNRSMVIAGFIRDCLERNRHIYEDDDSITQMVQIDIVIERLKEIGDESYVDLEN